MMLLKGKMWLIPNCMFSRKKRDGHRRVSHCYCCISDTCKAIEKMLLAGKWSEIRYLCSSISSKRLRILPETHQSTAEAGLEKMKYGLGLKREFPFKNLNFSLDLMTDYILTSAFICK